MEAAKKANPFAWLVQYLRESKEELEKVTWPSRQTVIRDTIVVIAISAGLAIFLGGADFGLATGFQKILESQLR